MITIRQVEWAGMGNQLFILAAGESFAHRCGYKFYLTNEKTPFNPHSQTNYYTTIFKNWVPFIIERTPGSLIESPNMGDILPNDVEIDGFFQDWRIVEPIRKQFIERLSFNTNIISKYPDISERVFIHVRGGDYLTWYGFVDLTNYYKKCLSMVNSKIVVFTNDLDYASKVLNHPFDCVVENEEDTLYLMSMCKGCICANSTFSWWGAYLNPNRQIFIPSKWTSDISNYSFPGTTIVDV